MKNGIVSESPNTRTVRAISGCNVRPRHSCKPGLIDESGRSMGRTSMRVRPRLSTRSTTPSFSSGAIVQVEYNTSPPGRSALHADSSSAPWRFAKPRIPDSLQRDHVDASERWNLPSPLQGTSARTRSKHRSCVLPIDSPGPVKTSTPSILNLASTVFSRIVLERLSSFASSMPRPFC